MKGNRASLLKSLRQENEELRNSLKQLSSEIDEVLERATQKPAARAPTDVDSKSKAICQSKIESLQKEIAKLKKQAHPDPYTRRLELEKEIQEASSKLKEATASLKLLKKQVNEKPATTDGTNAMRLLLEELRQVQADFKDTEEKYNRNLNFNSSTREKIYLLEEEASKIPKSQGNLPTDSEGKIEEKKQELKNLLNEKKDIRSRYTKTTDGINKKAEIQTKGNELLKGQMKAFDHNIKNLDTQLRVVRQSIKNLSRNPHVPSMLSETELNPQVPDEENKHESSNTEDKVKEETVVALEIAEPAKLTANEDSKANDSNEEKLEEEVKKLDS